MEYDERHESDTVRRRAPVDEAVLERWDRLEIHNFEELLEHEREIVDRINAWPKGGNLFMAHPFLLFEEIGVHLSERAIEEVRMREPYLATLSPRTYQAIKESDVEQPIRFRLSGLFRRDGGEDQ